MWEPIRFLAVGSLETLAAFMLMLSIFRLGVKDYIWQGLFIGLLMNLISLVVRNELSMPFLMPTISTIFYILLLCTVVRVPIMWSAVIAVIGMFIYTAFQGLVILAAVGKNPFDIEPNGLGIEIQLVCIIVTFMLAFFLDKFKIGFIADFETLRFKWEHVLVVAFILAALVACTVVMFFNNLLLIVLFLALAAAMFLYYAVMKEREEFDK
ncbi:hypothetical protein [Paenibacillus sp. FSL K6-1230]|uniref:hypothetical protein n=1 Tax=Paenibacillus sp. FSL K6-1230 TaxID=2921603 RepID=UPI0030FCAE0A